MTERGGVGVSTRGLVHIYRSEGHDVAALSGVDLQVAPGEIVGLLGPSGAGKSTLLTLFGGLLRPSAGSIRVDGQDLATLADADLDDYRATQVGMVLQGADRNLLPFLTPRQNVDFAGHNARARGRQVPEAGQVLDVVGIGPAADRPLAELAPGQRQLTALAVGVATFPGLLLADEPTSQLDHAARDTVLAAIAQVNAQVGTTVIVVTHDPEVAARLPRTVTIRDGRVGGGRAPGRGVCRRVGRRFTPPASRGPGGSGPGHAGPRAPGQRLVDHPARRCRRGGIRRSALSRSS